MKMYTKHEVNIMVQKQVKKAVKQKKRKRTEELHAFEKMSFSESDQESINSSSSKEGEIWKLDLILARIIVGKKQNNTLKVI